jgi:hypothetical protein
MVRQKALATGPASDRRTKMGAKAILLPCAQQAQEGDRLDAHGGGRRCRLTAHSPAGVVVCARLVKMQVHQLLMASFRHLVIRASCC